jgi:hypothetical protein
MVLLASSGLEVMLPARIKKVLGPSMGRDTGLLTVILSGFPQSLQASAKYIDQATSACFQILSNSSI